MEVESTAETVSGAADVLEVKADTKSMWLWILQRATGILLIGLLFFHMLILHYVDPSEIIDVGFVQVRLRNLLFGGTDTALLIAVIFHAMNGVRAVVYDYISDISRRRLTSTILIALGVVLAAYGLWAFIPFILDL